MQTLNKSFIHIPRILSDNLNKLCIKMLSGYEIWTQRKTIFSTAAAVRQIKPYSIKYHPTTIIPQTYVPVKKKIYVKYKNMPYDREGENMPFGFLHFINAFRPSGRLPPKEGRGRDCKDRRDERASARGWQTEGTKGRGVKPKDCGVDVKTFIIWRTFVFYIFRILSWYHSRRWQRHLPQEKNHSSLNGPYCSIFLFNVSPVPLYPNIIHFHLPPGWLAAHFRQ